MGGGAAEEIAKRYDAIAGRVARREKIADIIAEIAAETGLNVPTLKSAYHRIRKARGGGGAAGDKRQVPKTAAERFEALRLYKSDYIESIRQRDAFADFVAEQRYADELRKMHDEIGEAATLKGLRAVGIGIRSARFQHWLKTGEVELPAGSTAATGGTDQKPAIGSDEKRPDSARTGDDGRKSGERRDRPVRSVATPDNGEVDDGVPSRVRGDETI